MAPAPSAGVLLLAALAGASAASCYLTDTYSGGSPPATTAGSAGASGAAGQAGLAGQAGQAGSGGVAGQGGQAGGTSGKCVALAQAYCQLQASCDQLAAIGQSTEIGCELRAQQSCEASLKLGNSLLGDAQIASCTSTFKQFACESLALGPVESCGQPGTLADGEPCEVSFQCKGALCEAAEGACGKCTTLPTKGHACDPAKDLCFDSFCSPDKVCVGWAQKSDPCATTYQCDSQLACSGGKCVDALGQGQTCNPAQDLCEDGLHCEAVPKATTGSCQEPSLLVSGAACKAGDPNAFCEDGEVCRGGSCQVPLADGAACALDGDCLAPARCITGKCVLYGACTKK